MHEQHRVAHRKLLPEGDEPPEHPKRREHRPGGIEEDEGVETHLDVLGPEAEEEVAEEEARDLRDVGGVADARLLLAVPRGDGDVLHPHAIDVHPDQEVVAVAIALVDVVEGEGREGPGRDRGVAVLRVHHLPVTRGDLGEEGEDRVAKAPPLAHTGPVVFADEAVALGIVGLAVDDGIEEGGEVGRIHLVVPCHDGDEIHLVLDRPEVA